ncbi:diguanylate cyclase/phosphodiesterase (GGDEF & EAL domains) with PAS/PAC sensor(s) [hydrothermal vent metagenome]|uniref:Diguanylate cyclase/phosphodiesterase (GGDEF & EAL domains) with PAS/PAC sensor(S) n=1 Tax=hydrothermal vent metagenome TaxID=652676 RepID=A0A3B1B166_9ZZZZ
MDNKPFIEAYQEINSRFIKLLSSMSALRSLSSIEIKYRDENEIIDDSLRVLLDYHELDYVSIFMYESDSLKQIACKSWNAGSKCSGSKYQALCNEHWVLLSEVETTHKVQQINQAPGENFTGSASAIPINAGDKMIGIFLACHPADEFFSVSNERNLVIYCNFLGQLIMNNRLLHGMDEMVNERTQQLQEALDETRILKQRYEALSIIDEMTKLHNRRFFFPETRAAIAQAIRYKKSFSVLMMDVDHFKIINDRYGHAMGDEVLKDIAIAFKTEAREADILARFGGEEFVFALPETDESGAMVMAERIRTKVKSMRWQADGKDISITITIGITELENRTTNDYIEALDELLQQADLALYHGKDCGRDQYNLYSSIAGLIDTGEETG